MSSVGEIKKIADYAAGAISLGSFEDWFYEASGEPPDAGSEDAIASIDALLSARHFEGLSQGELRDKLKELANAISG